MAEHRPGIPWGRGTEMAERVEPRWVRQAALGEAAGVGATQKEARVDTDRMVSYTERSQL